ncbi:hypothetical protein F5X68DRAFT_273598 [Plectosphaerella plurivora]|uniref:Uncharacterized protein n=1 Tax=Plectosphaerella plurivora TaxID=936078 RepID=A0A9P8VHS1_9PEZI|nr:hypothetical protein F5X68DRAFT_273598 [Plectosphaerella plurivora]
MEESAPKRRKTSPRTSIPIRSAGSQAPATTAPNEQTRPQRPKRPSFASPTKSSLARSNPDIFDRRRSSQRQREQVSPVRGASQPIDDNDDDAPVAGSDPAAAPEANVPSQDADTQPSLSQPPRRRSGRDILDATLRAREQPVVSTPVSQPTQEAEPSSVGTPSRRPTRRNGGGMGALPRRSPVRPVPRPLPPVEGSPEEDFNPFAGRVLQRTPPGGRQTEPEAAQPAPPLPEPILEAELPPTPTQLGLDDPVVTSPAKGIHDSPSFRARRRSSKQLKSSPLKAPPLRPPTEAKQKGEPSKLKLRGKSPVRPRASDKSLVIEIDDDDDDDVEFDDDLEDPIATGPHPARKLVAYDSLPEKAALLEKLRAEAAQLEADLALATEENERIREARTQRRTSSKQPLEPPPDPEAIVGLLRRQFLPANNASVPNLPDLAAQIFGAAMEPTSWFSLATSNSIVAPARTQEEALPPVTHEPVPMNSEEQLPFLQAFTPFTLTSTTFMLPRVESGSPLFRQHNISISTTSPTGLFAAKVEMVVNTDTLRIAELRVPRLDPAAIAELGPFVEAQCAGKRNMSVMCWAMGEWYRIAVERARFWCELEHQVQTKEGLAELVKQARMSKRRKKRRRDGDEDESGTSSGSSAVQTSSHAKRGAVLAHMGRTSFEIPIPEEGEDEGKWSRLRVQWRIEFDWTGEGRSQVGVMVGMPGKWHQSSDGGLLPSIRKVFAGLVRGEKDPSAAVRTVIALLAGDLPGARG